MAPRTHRPRYQPLSFLEHGVGNLARSGGAVTLGVISPRVQQRLFLEVYRHIDTLPVVEAVNDLCRTYGFRPTGDELMIGFCRAVRVTAQVQFTRELPPDKITSTLINFLPSALSELLLGLAAVHANWSLIAYTPALTLLPILLAAKGRSQPTLLKEVNRGKAKLPSEQDVRSSVEFQFALGWTAGWLQANPIAEDASNSTVLMVGNEALAVFQESYEDAIYGRVDIDKLSRWGRDGAYLIEQREHAMNADLGCEATVPPFLPEHIEAERDPVIAAAMHCDETLADEAKRSELGGLLQAALEELSRRQLDAWSLRYIHEMNDDAMAREMGVDKHTARTHLKRAEASIASGAFVATLEDLANHCEDKALFKDLVSMFLGPQALAAATKTLTNVTEEPRSPGGTAPARTEEDKND